MSRMQLAAIFGAIVIAGGLVAFGPQALDRYQQSQRDDSFDCSMYRLAVSTDNLAALSGQRPDRAETERKGRAGGCTPVR
jgi:hypothetical protein